MNTKNDRPLEPVGFRYIDVDSKVAPVSMSIGVNKDHGLVIVEFDRAIKWISFDYNDAIRFIEVLAEKAGILLETGNDKEAS